MAKNQLPVVGGIRKVVKTPPAQTPGTTIAEYGSGTITLAQLRQALGVIVTKPNTQGGGGGGAGATIVPGPGLSGGGPVLGNVPINLTAPIPVFIFDDSGGGDGDAAPIPGQTGPAGIGTTGAAGPAGPAIFLLADDPDEALNAVPGAVGPQGILGATGGVGPAGPALFMLAEDGQDGEPGPPGVSAAASTVASANITPDTHPASPNAADDEFEGAALDTAGTRRAGATAWTLFSVGTNTQVLADGSLVLTQVAGGQVWNIISQPAPATPWRYRTKVALSVPSAAPVAGFVLYNDTSNKLIQVGFWPTGPLVWFNQTGPLPGSTFGSSVFSGNLAQNDTNPTTSWGYFEVENDGTNIIFRASVTGVSGSFQELVRQTLATWIGSVDRVCLSLNTNATGQVATFDWFRRMA